MICTKSVALDSALDLNGLVLGMWEVAVLLQNDSTKKAAFQKLKRLRTRLEDLDEDPVVRDSLHFFLDINLQSKTYSSVLDRLEEGRVSEVLPEIEALALETNAQLHESGRETTDFRRSPSGH
jgi:hypothetical protein